MPVWNLIQALEAWQSTSKKKELAINYLSLVTEQSLFRQLLAKWYSVFQWGLVVATSVGTTQDKGSRELSSTDRVTTDLPNRFQQDSTPCRL